MQRIFSLSELAISEPLRRVQQPSLSTSRNTFIDNRSEHDEPTKQYCHEILRNHRIRRYCPIVLYRHKQLYL